MRSCFLHTSSQVRPCCLSMTKQATDACTLSTRRLHASRHSAHHTPCWHLSVVGTIFIPTMQMGSVLCGNCDLLLHGAHSIRTENPTSHCMMHVVLPTPILLGRYIPPTPGPCASCCCSFKGAPLYLVAALKAAPDLYCSGSQPACSPHNTVDHNTVIPL